MTAQMIMKAKDLKYYCNCGMIVNSAYPSHIAIHTKSAKHKRNLDTIMSMIQPYPQLWATATIEETKSPEVPEVYEKKPYPQLWAKSIIESIRPHQDIRIRFYCTLTIEEKGAIINALKFKFLTNDKMKIMLKRNNYIIKIVRGIHSSSAYGFHFNGCYIDADTLEEKTPTMHFNLLNFKWENIPCITTITNMNYVG
jgi:hypothetical protein